MPLIYGPRIGFNYEKSYNPRNGGRPPVHRIIERNTEYYRGGANRGSSRESDSDLYVNSFINRELDHDAFHAEVDQIRADRVAGITTKERVMI